ncbi:hypothetical protein BJY04DRAFT_217187 [Aspergillus karnatakaensis]|uniref:uncharacterized protein n=1 Tax=Aspergillus karnatakaensis TaxID=1810916 RepID=UPI003CCCB667
MADSTTTTGFLSLHDIITRRRDLLVDPIAWTAYHLEQVGCQFKFVEDNNTEPSSAADEVKATETEAPSNSNEQDTTDQTQMMPPPTTEENSDPGNPSAKYAEQLISSRSIRAKRVAMYSLLTGEDIFDEEFEKTPCLRFNGHKVSWPRMSLFYRLGLPSKPLLANAPYYIGYINYSDLKSTRRRATDFTRQISSTGVADEVNVRIMKKTLARLTPEDWRRDPYFLCHLLTLAQGSRSVWRRSEEAEKMGIPEL